MSKTFKDCEYNSKTCIHYREGRCVKDTHAACPVKKALEEQKKRRKKYGM